MPRKSKREIERAIEEVQAAAGSSADVPQEIFVRRRTVETEDGTGGELVYEARVWRDETGEWHSERTGEGCGE